VLTDEVDHVLLGQGSGQVGVQKAVPELLGRGLQVFDRVGTNRLNDVGSHVTKGVVHLGASPKK